MPWLQVRLAITPEQAETYEDALLEVGAVSVTFMDAEDQPIFEPDLGTTPAVVAHPPAGAVRSGHR